jgi:hypothetical protein
MANFTVRVKPEIIQERVSAAQTRDLDRLAAQFKLDKGEIYGDGVDISEAQHLPFDAFMQLSDNDTKITKADLLKFAGTETEEDVVREYARNIAASLPAKIADTTPRPDNQQVGTFLEFKVKKRGEDIVIQAERSLPHQGTEATAAGVFSIINGRDANQDGKISIGGELMGSAFVSTAGDALKLAQGDMFITPTEALQAIFEKAEKFAPADVDITYNGQ